MKKLFSLIFLSLLLIPVLSSGEDLYEEQLNKGIRNSEPYAYVLIKQSKADTAHAKEILRKALRYSHDLPAVYFELSKASFSFSIDGIFESVDYMLQGISAYHRNFWWSFTIVGSLYMSVIISFIISVIIIIVIGLSSDLPLLSHDIKEVKTKVLLLLVLASALAGPIFLIGSLLFLLGLYLKKWDRIVIYLYLLFLLISPLVFKTISMFFNAPASHELKAVVQVNESKDNKYALSVLKNRNDNIARFSYALALKREGRYDEAADIYKKLILKNPDPKLYINLANCYVGLNDIERAKEYYRKSIEMKPLPSAYYNLSQVLRESLDFVKGEENFFAAQKLDHEAVSRFQAIFGKNPNRFVIDESMPVSTLWIYAQGKTRDVSTMGLSIIPSIGMSVIAIFLMVLFYVVNRRVKHRSYRCKRCGTILCNKCEKHILWGRMCIQCYRSLVKLDELDAKERVARLLTVYEYQKRRRDKIKFISFILPGLAQIYAGDVLYGLLFLWTFLFFLCIPVMNSIFLTETFSFSHLWLYWSSLVLMIAVYFLSNIITRRRLAKGWL
ncbi:MAG: tetratricopeptide repeat protein [Nitrospirota bacterium]|nr:tetratricopeptide repeat protein [Nitrospirota bacterium]MDH5768215.1 tetratricopeptide repeat protein [Nitrospirota bacterium]